MKKPQARLMVRNAIQAATTIYERNQETLSKILHEGKPIGEDMYTFFHDVYGFSMNPKDRRQNLPTLVDGDREIVLDWGEPRLFKKPSVSQLVDGRKTFIDDHPLIKVSELQYLVLLEHVSILAEAHKDLTFEGFSELLAEEKFIAKWTIPIYAHIFRTDMSTNELLVDLSPMLTAPVLGEEIFGICYDAEAGEYSLTSSPNVEGMMLKTDLDYGVLIATILFCTCMNTTLDQVIDYMERNQENDEEGEATNESEA